MSLELSRRSRGFLRQLCSFLGALCLCAGLLAAGSAIAGDCYSEEAGPGCDDPAIEACVCAADDYCCDVRWDALCVEEVTTLGCGAPSVCSDGVCEGTESCSSCPHDCGPCAGDCEVSHATTGCEDTAITACVCSADDYCCDVRWDAICAGEVASLGCAGACGDGVCDASIGEHPATCAEDCGVCGEAICATNDRAVYTPCDPEAWSEWTYCDGVCGDGACEPAMQVGFVINDDDYTISDAEIEEVLGLASDMLEARIGIPMVLNGIEHVFDDSLWFSTSPHIDDYHYLHGNRPPHYVVAFAETHQSLTYGGMAASSTDLDHLGYCNNFVSPLPDYGTSRIYGGTVAWDHRVGSCGYDMDHYLATGEWLQISATSTEAAHVTECNEAGLTCVYNGGMGYWMCPTADLADPRYSHRRAFVAQAIVHEVLHRFGLNGNQDHFATLECDAMMGGEDYEDSLGAYTALAYAVMCPYTFDELAASWNEDCESL